MSFNANWQLPTPPAGLPGVGGGGAGAGNGLLQQALQHWARIRGAGGGGWQGPRAYQAYQQVALNRGFPGEGGGTIGGIDIPPADMADPFRAADLNPGDFHSSPFNLMSFFTGFGTGPSFGSPAFGNTAIPTWWTNYPGVGNVPYAVPPGGWAGQAPGEDHLSKGTPPLKDF